VYIVDSIIRVFEAVNRLGADLSGAAVWGTNSLRPLKHWDRDFESHSSHGCLFAFILGLFCSVGR
jgi:hypothetical protein